MNSVRRFGFPVLLALCLSVVAASNAVPSAAATKHWVCPPCRLPCDDVVYDAPGTCPKCGMALVDQEVAAKLARHASKKIALLIFTGVEIIDYTAPYEVFGHTDSDVYTVAETKDPITTVMGMKVVPNYAFSDAPGPDVLVVPGGGIQGALSSAATMNWIRDTSSHAGLTMSVCNGAFLLAAAGLLDGLSATTTAGRIDELKEKYPAIRVVRNQRYVDNGKIITTAGLSSGIDGALHVVERLFGKGTAQEVALMVEYEWRPGSGFARASMADRLIPNVSMRQIGDWKIERTEGTSDRWEKVLRGRSEKTAAEISDFISRSFEAGRWKPVPRRAAPAGTAAASDWTFAGREGEPWAGTLTVEPVAGETGAYVVRLTIARATGRAAAS
jgi:putative intracellular protease/amidase